MSLNSDFGDDLDVPEVHDEAPGRLRQVASTAASTAMRGLSSLFGMQTRWTENNDGNDDGSALSVGQEGSSSSGVNVNAGSHPSDNHGSTSGGPNSIPVDSQDSHSRTSSAAKRQHIQGTPAHISHQPQKNPLISTILQSQNQIQENVDGPSFPHANLTGAVKQFVGGNQQNLYMNQSATSSSRQSRELSVESTNTETPTNSTRYPISKTVSSNSISSQLHQQIAGDTASGAAMYARQAYQQMQSQNVTGTQQVSTIDEENAKLNTGSSGDQPQATISHNGAANISTNLDNNLNVEKLENVSRTTAIPSQGRTVSGAHGNESGQKGSSGKTKGHHSHQGSLANKKHASSSSTSNNSRYATGAVHPTRTSFRLWVHDEAFSKEQLVINPEYFPFVKVGDLLEIRPQVNYAPVKDDYSSRRQHKNVGIDDGISGPSYDDNKIFLQVTKIDSQLIQKQQSLQISIAQELATSFGLSSRSDISVKLIEKSKVALDFLELSYRDQYIGRNDMWRIKLEMQGTSISKTRKLNILGTRMRVETLYINGKTATSGFITENTKIIFRSLSAKYFIFIQMSKEMWDFDEDGELNVEKCLHGFLPELFAKWKQQTCSHIVTLVLFTRITYPNYDPKKGVGIKIDLDSNKHMTSNLSQRSMDDHKTLYNSFKKPSIDNYFDENALSIDSQGRYYRDYYRVVINWETNKDWNYIIPTLNKEFTSFRRDTLQALKIEGQSMLNGENTFSSDGNILEAVNLALNPYDKHYIDRDLTHTGLSILVITPGSGIYQVDKHLCRLTAHRMIDNGIGLDVICLSRPPLYTVPLLQYVSKNYMEKKQTSENKKIQGSQNPQQNGNNSSANVKNTMTFNGPSKLENWDPLYYDDPDPKNPPAQFQCIPNWMDCSFWARNESIQSFPLRCKMFEVQMMGLMEEVGNNIIVPHLDTQNLNNLTTVLVNSHMQRDRSSGSDFDKLHFKMSNVSLSQLNAKYPSKTQLAGSSQHSGTGNTPLPSDSQGRGVRFDFASEDDTIGTGAEESTSFPCELYDNVVFDNSTNLDDPNSSTLNHQKLGSKKDPGAMMNYQEYLENINNTRKSNRNSIGDSTGLGLQQQQGQNQSGSTSYEKNRRSGTGSTPSPDMYNGGSSRGPRSGINLNTSPSSYNNGIPQQIDGPQITTQGQQLLGTSGSSGPNSAPTTTDHRVTYDSTNIPAFAGSLFIHPWEQREMINARDKKDIGKAKDTINKLLKKPVATAGNTFGGIGNSSTQSLVQHKAVSGRSLAEIKDKKMRESSAAPSSASSVNSTSTTTVGKLNVTKPPLIQVPESSPLDSAPDVSAGGLINPRFSAIDPTPPPQPSSVQLKSRGNIVYDKPTELSSASSTLAGARNNEFASPLISSGPSTASIKLQGDMNPIMINNNLGDTHNVSVNYSHMTHSQSPSESYIKVGQQYGAGNSGGSTYIFGGRSPVVNELVRHKNGSPSKNFHAHGGGSLSGVDSGWFNNINPCNPRRNVIRATSDIRRWQHVLPLTYNPLQNSVWMNWKSVCYPASLPLTTDYFPLPEELSELYQEYTYNVSPADDFSTTVTTRIAQGNTQRGVSVLLKLVNANALVSNLVISNVQKVGSSGSAGPHIGPTTNTGPTVFGEQPINMHDSSLSLGTSNEYSMSNVNSDILTAASNMLIKSNNDINGQRLSTMNQPQLGGISLSEFGKAYMLLIELVGQRVAQGFQLIVGNPTVNIKIPVSNGPATAVNVNGNDASSSQTIQPSIQQQKQVDPQHQLQLQHHQPLQLSNANKLQHNMGMNASSLQPSKTPLLQVQPPTNNLTIATQKPTVKFGKLGLTVLSAADSTKSPAMTSPAVSIRSGTISGPSLLTSVGRNMMTNTLHERSASLQKQTNEKDKSSLDKLSNATRDSMIQDSKTKTTVDDSKSEDMSGDTVKTGPNELDNVKSVATSLTAQTVIAKLLEEASIPFYLSLGDNVHKLSYDVSGNNIEVKRYVRKSTFPTSSINYSAFIFPKEEEDGYRHKKITFHYPQLNRYNWNYLDHHVSGYQDEMTESLRFWRTRMVLIPAESVNLKSSFLNPRGDDLDEEEIRLVGFEKFMETIERLRVDNNESNSLYGKKRKGTRTLQILPTTLNLSRFIKEEVCDTNSQLHSQGVLPKMDGIFTKRKFIGSVEPNFKLTKNSPANVFLTYLLMDPPAGLSMKDRRWHFKLYKRVLVGNEFVDWVINKVSDIDNRDEAAELGNKYLTQGFFEHVLGKKTFLDGHYFYRVREEFFEAYGPKGSTNEDVHNSPLPLENVVKPNQDESSSIMREISPKRISIPEIDTSGVGSGLNSTGKLTFTGFYGSNTNNTCADYRTEEVFDISRAMTLDLDPHKRSKRMETAVIHYDTIHNPKVGFHLHLQWLACGARTIEDLLLSWSRTAEKCGLKLVEAGVDQATQLSDDNPFQSLTRIKFAKLPDIDRLNKELSSKLKFKLDFVFYQFELLNKLGFVLDVETIDNFPHHIIRSSHTHRQANQRTQWIYRTGIAFVQLDGEDFLWVPNRIHLTGLARLLSGTTTINNSMSIGGVSGMAGSVMSNSTTISHNYGTGPILSNMIHDEPKELITPTSGNVATVPQDVVYNKNVRPSKGSGGSGDNNSSSNVSVVEGEPAASRPNGSGSATNEVENNVGTINTNSNNNNFNTQDIPSKDANVTELDLVLEKVMQFCSSERMLTNFYNDIEAELRKMVDEGGVEWASPVDDDTMNVATPVSRRSSLQ